MSKVQTAPPATMGGPAKPPLKFQSEVKVGSAPALIRKRAQAVGAGHVDDARSVRGRTPGARGTDLRGEELTPDSAQIRGVEQVAHALLPDREELGCPEAESPP